MIQRIQTVWLLLATTSMALTFKFKFAVGGLVENGQTVLKNVTSSSDIISLILALSFIALSVYNIILFKNRKRQMAISWLTVLIGLICIYFLYRQTQLLVDVTYAISSVLPFIAIGFTITAWRCIRQDEKLIKESNSDRLR